jgi:hypothetical protein
MPPQDDPLKHADRQSPDYTTDERQQNQKRVTQQRSSKDLEDQMRQDKGNSRRKHPLDRAKKSYAHMNVLLIREDSFARPMPATEPRRRGRGELTLVCDGSRIRNPASVLNYKIRNP